MAKPLQSRIPLVTLDAGCVVVFEAVDPTTGARVAGVTASNVALYAQHNGPGTAVFKPTQAEWLNLPVEG